MTRGQAREGFDKDLLFGQAREDAFLRMLLGNVYVEHKADERARETGSLAIEFETSECSEGLGEKKPSGIATTDAGWWAHEFQDSCWIFVPTERMRQLAAAAWQVWGGDNNRFHLALVKWTALLKPPPDASSDDGQPLTL
jgi:hypothetical protein